MALDSSGELKDMVYEFVHESDIAKRKALVGEILILWAGQKDTRPSSRGAFMDAQQLGVLEAFWGMPSPHTNPDARYTSELSVIYQQLQNSIYTQMVLPQYVDFLSLINTEVVAGGLQVDFSEVAGKFAGLFNSENPNAKYYLDEFIELVKGLDPYNTASEYSPDHFMNALLPEIRKLPLDIQNEFFGAIDWANGAIKGTDGDDILYSLNKDDLILGGKGDDNYMIFRGNGNDVISDSGGIDKIIIGEGILPEQISLHRSFDSLVIKLDSGEKIDVAGMFRNPASASVHNIKDERIAAFVGGLSTGWLARAEKLIEEYYGLVGGGNITLEFTEGEYGGVAASVISGYRSTDPAAKSVFQTLKVELADFDFATLSLSNGSLDIDRVVAHEMVHAIMANNMFIFGFPDWFVEGTAELIHGADERVNADIELISSQESFNSFFDLSQSVESTFYSVSYIAVKYLDFVIRENGGNGIKDVFDYLKTGKTLDQTLSLMSNAHPTLLLLWTNLASFEEHFKEVGFFIKDTLLNLNDSDTGSIAGSDYGNPALNNKSVLPDDLPSASLRFNLIVPEIYIDQSIPPINTSIERIVFADGTIWNLAEILARVVDSPEVPGTNYGHDFDDIISGGEKNDTLRGLEGNDLLSGRAGNDVLIGDEGNDKLNGGVDDDLLIGGLGDDFYIYSPGDGDDTIEDSSGYDSIEISDVWIDSVAFHSKQDGTLILSMPNGGSITIPNAINMHTGEPSEKAIETINGRGWEYIKGRVLRPSNDIHPIYGFGSDDWLIGQHKDNLLYGAGGDDTIHGLGGNDQLFGGAGNDILYGGYGDNSLSGGSGSDLFVIEGHGRDRISDAESSDSMKIDNGGSLTPYINRNDLIFSLANGGSVIFENAVDNNGLLIREKIVGSVTSASGTWDYDQIVQEVWEFSSHRYSGDDENNVLVGIKR